jgi:DNA-binding transcriptional ArsR family regulator
VEEIVLDRKTFGALAIESRIRILKALRERRKTQSELASEMQMAVSTISEHIEKLAEAGLIKRMEDGHRWVYYELTPKGEQILSPQKSASVFIFALSVSILMVVLGASAFYNLEPAPVYGGPAMAAAPGGVAPETPGVLSAGAPAAAGGADASKCATCGAENLSQATGNVSGQAHVSDYKTVQNMNPAAALSIGAGVIVLVLALYYWARR